MTALATLTIGLAGLVALADLARRSGAGRRAARTGMWLQGLHVVEHVALTTGTALAGTAIGVTTGFGLLAPGPGLWTTRVLAHFAINAVATATAVRAGWLVARAPARVRTRRAGHHPSHV